MYVGRTTQQFSDVWRAACWKLSPLTISVGGRIRRTVVKAAGGPEGVLEMQRSLRRPLVRLRPLPDFLVIGAQKSGTTSLYASLVRHPSVRTALTREVHFFDNNFTRGLVWYRAHFPASWSGKRTWLTGEATPYYLLHPLVPARAASVTPDARIIAVLRHPVDRLYSHYQHERAKGTELLDFDDALARESERTEDDFSRLATGRIARAPSVQRHTYRARSLYDEQMARWLQHYPRGQLKVIQAERLYTEPATTMAEIFRFLGLAPPSGLTYPKLNARSYLELDPRTRAALGASFRESVQRLCALLDQDFDWDL